MHSVLPWLIGLVVLAATGIGLWYTFRRTSGRPGPDPYLEALELWIAGDLEAATAALKDVVRDRPESIDPFLQLGNLLRLQGEARRAAVLHRGLTVRPDLPRSKRTAVGLALAEDLIALGAFAEAGQVLDGVSREGMSRPVYWRARFRQWYGLGNLPNAARALKHSVKSLSAKDRPGFQDSYASFQLDRALAHALAGEATEARARLNDVKRIPAAAARAQLVRAMLAAVADDAEEALAATAEGLLEHPRELTVFLPFLQDVLLRFGHYARSIPILERACQAEGAPPSLWVNLALLYEKLDQRDKVFRLLEAKAGAPDFTPDVASPLLRLLAMEQEGGDFPRLWNLLSLPAAPTGWVCRSCGRVSDRLRWFCPDCLEFDTYTEPVTSRGES